MHIIDQTTLRIESLQLEIEEVNAENSDLKARINDLITENSQVKNDIREEKESIIITL